MIFCHLLVPLGTPRGRLLAYFSIFLQYCCYFFDDSFPELFLASLLDVSVTPRTFKIWPNHCTVARKQSYPPKSKKLAPETDFASMFDTFWNYFGDISGYLGAQTTLFKAFGFPVLFY